MGAGRALVVARGPPLVVGAAHRRARLPRERVALARERRDVELVIAVDVADRGDREDPAPGELREARPLLPGRVEVAQQVEPGADQQLAAGRVGDVGDGWAREQLVVLDRLRIGRQRLAGRAAPRLHDVVVGQVLPDRDAEVDEAVERQPAAHDLEAGQAVEVGGDRVLEQVEDLRLVGVLAAAGRRVERRAPRAVGLVGLDVAGDDAADDLELRVGVEVAEHVVVARGDERQRVGDGAVGLDRPAGQDMAGRVERVGAPGSADRVGEDVDEPALQQAGEIRRAVGRAGRARVVVELGGRRDDLRPAVAGDVADGGRGDDLGARQRGVAQLHREALDRVALAVPAVDVLVERADHDLERAVALQVGERGRRDEAALDVVGARAVLRPREVRVHAHREARDLGAVEVPGVDVLAGGVDDLRLEVAVDVPDGRRPQRLARRLDAVEPRGLRAHGREHAGLHRPAAVEGGERAAPRSSTRRAPLESASTTSRRLSPSTSHSRSDASPPVPRRRIQPASSVSSR